MAGSFVSNQPAQTKFSGVQACWGSCWLDDGMCGETGRLPAANLSAASRAKLNIVAIVYLLNGCAAIHVSS